MREAKNRASMSHDMATTNRGVILPAERGSRGWPPGNAGRGGRNAFEEPADFESGSHGMIGGNDWDNTNDYDGDFDGDDDPMMGGGRSHG
jgi:hypothetical protein